MNAHELAPVLLFVSRVLMQLVLTTDERNLLETMIYACAFGNQPAAVEGQPESDEQALVSAGGVLIAAGQVWWDRQGYSRRGAALATQVPTRLETPSWSPGVRRRCTIRLRVCSTSIWRVRTPLSSPNLRNTSCKRLALHFMQTVWISHDRYCRSLFAQDFHAAPRADFYYLLDLIAQQDATALAIASNHFGLLPLTSWR